jgi:putative acetyltransferase
MVIRKEQNSDLEVITAVTITAFKNHPFSRQTEHLIINALRLANALTLSLVAEIRGQVVGHIAFSPLEISDGSEGWFGLGPVSVLPGYQNQGIGKVLINKGLSILKDQGGQGCALGGSPDYYLKF